MRFTLLVFAIFILNLPVVWAQSILLEENFNSCAFPAGWQANLTGNQNAQWYVGLSQNSGSLNQSIDSTCMLFIDDNATGNGTAGYLLNFLSPAFDASQHETVELSLDVHYRHKGGSQQYLDILITDGTTEQLLTRFKSDHSNSAPIQNHFSLKYDLRLLTQSTQVQLIIRYNDPAGEFGWWAGIDNIQVLGSGTNTLVLGEAFNGCAKPAGWQTEILSGGNDWSFGLVPITSSAYYDGYSMDGSCFVFFDENAAGGTAPPTSLRLLSPWFDANNFFHYQLAFDFMLRYNGETILIYVENDAGAKFPLFESQGHVAGPFFPSYLHLEYDLTPYRSTQLRIGFEYKDNGAHGYWVGLDNFKVTADGPAMDFCADAQQLFTGMACLPANNTTALFDGPVADCSGRTEGSLWYKWEADFDGIARFNTQAKFNDVVNVFTGSCAGLQSVACNNRDEHGFHGELTYFPAQSGTTYYLRTSGLADGFGVSRGDLCVSLEQATDYPSRPANDDCANALLLTQGTACTLGNNYNANNSAYLPALNELARSDVWYKFVASPPGPGEYLEFRSQADFSDIITLYEGSCANLTEIGSNYKGGSLALPSLVNGQTYYVQVAGTFASVEGTLCPELQLQTTAPPINDNCLNAQQVTLGADCVSANNESATFSGYQPKCAVAVDRDLWFQFKAPAFGSVKINTGATFEHTLAVWEGTCDSLEQVYCARNPLRCEGYVTVGSLKPDQTYFVQIASLQGASGLSAGDVCLKILNGQSESDINPMELQVLQPCVSMDTARLFIRVTGGRPPYTFLADTNRTLVPSGSPFAVIIMDIAGCQVQLLDTAHACASNICTTNIEVLATPVSCFGGSDGKLIANVSGASGSLSFHWSNNVFTASNADLPAGDYQLTVTELNGCEYILAANLWQPDSILIYLDSLKQPFIGNSNGLLFVNTEGGTPPYHFTWLRNDTFLIADQEDLDSLPGGTYTLIIEDSSGCKGSFSYILVETVSTQNGPDAFNVILYPNPTQGRVNLSVKLPQTLPLNISLLDAHGREVLVQLAEPVDQEHITLDVHKLPPGLYLLHLRAGEAQVTRQLVIGR